VEGAFCFGGIDPISSAILRGKFSEGDTIGVDAEDEEINLGSKESVAKAT